MKVITFNINGAGDNKEKKKENVQSLRNLYKPDLFLIQEAVEEQAMWLAPKGLFMKRGMADAHEGGYVVDHGADVTELTGQSLSFISEFEFKTFGRLRPPLRIECKWKKIRVKAYTWHAPFEWKALGGSKQAAAAYRKFLTTEIDDMYEAARGKFIWLLAGDLNLESSLLRMITRDVLPKNLMNVARLKTSKPKAKSHALMFYGGEEKIQPTQMEDKLKGKKSFSPHRWLAVRFPTSDMLRADQKKITS